MWGVRPCGPRCPTGPDATAHPQPHPPPLGHTLRFMSVKRMAARPHTTPHTAAGSMAITWLVSWVWTCMGGVWGGGDGAVEGVCG